MSLRIVIIVLKSQGVFTLTNVIEEPFQPKLFCATLYRASNYAAASHMKLRLEHEAHCHSQPVLLRGSLFVFPWAGIKLHTCDTGTWLMFSNKEGVLGFLKICRSQGYPMAIVSGIHIPYALIWHFGLSRPQCLCFVNSKPVHLNKLCTMMVCYPHFCHF